MTDPHRIQDEQELRAIIGYPSELVNQKVIHHLDEHCVEFIQHTPIVFLSTSDASGACDVSQRGDEPGFIRVMDSKRLIIPERPGNRRSDTFRNLLDNPHIGMLLLIPPLEETLRINGRAYISKEPELLNSMQAQGKLPLLAIVVEVEECYVHCAKAFKRSKLWNPNQWSLLDQLPKPATMLAAHAMKNVEDVEKSLQESYIQRMY